MNFVLLIANCRHFKYISRMDDVVGLVEIATVLLMNSSVFVPKLTEGSSDTLKLCQTF